LTILKKHKYIFEIYLFIKLKLKPNMKDEKNKKEQYATDNPLEATNSDLEKMAKEAIKKFKSMQ